MKTVALFWFLAGAMVTFGFVFTVIEGPRLENIVPPVAVVFGAVWTSRLASRKGGSE